VASPLPPFPKGLAALGASAGLLQALAAVVLLAIFLTIHRFSASRQLSRLWSCVWLGAALWFAPGGLLTLQSMAGWSTGPTLVSAFLGLWSDAGAFLFLAMVGLGSLEASGIQRPRSLDRRVGFGAVLLGVILTLLDAKPASQALQALLTPVSLLGGAVVVLLHSRGDRWRGRLVVGISLALLGTCLSIAQIYGLRDVVGPASPGQVIWRLSGLLSAIGVMLLGATAIVMVMQESFLEALVAQRTQDEQLARSEARLRGTLEAAAEAIVLINDRGEIELANRGAEALFRIPAGQAAGRPASEVLQVASVELEGWIRDIRSGTLPPAVTDGVTREADGFRPDGSVFPIEFTVGVIDLEQRAGLVVVLRDLSDRKAAEEAKARFERRMAESEKMLAIGRVVSGVAHELNNPLAVVLGQSEQLVEVAGSDDVRTGLRMINEQAQRARHIVKDLLAFVRSREERREPVDLSPLIDRVIASQTPEAMLHGVTIHADLAAAVPPVEANRAGIEQVLVNLLDNAMDAAGRGGTITVRLAARGQLASLSVEDSGPGVPESIEERIFEPFFTTKPPGQGTGLGLSVSRGLAQQSGGSLRLENRPVPGVGARFVLEFPLMAVPLAEPRPRIPVLPPPPRLPDGSLAAALIIDDEPTVRATLARILQRGGWTVREAGTGEEGLEVLEGQFPVWPPAVILCDLKMPGIGGQGFHAALRRDRPDLLRRLVIVTGDMVEANTAAFVAGAGCEVVEKPFTVAEIARAVEGAVIDSP
jgi:two-component system NtrC family sensor kinase